MHFYMFMQLPTMEYSPLPNFPVWGTRSRNYNVFVLQWMWPGWKQGDRKSWSGKKFYKFMNHFYNWQLTIDHRPAETITVNDDDTLSLDANIYFIFVSLYGVWESFVDHNTKMHKFFLLTFPTFTGEYFQNTCV